MKGTLCEACDRPSAFRKPLWFRSRAGGLRFAGWYGRQCFYRVARAYAKGGFAVQHDPGGRPLAWRDGSVR